MRPSTSFKPKWRVLKTQALPGTQPEAVNGPEPPTGWRFLPYLLSTMMIALLTALFWIVGYAFTPVNIALLYLLPVFIAAVRWGLWPSFYAAGVGVIAFDFFFIPQ